MEREPFLQGAESWTGLACSGNNAKSSVTGVRGMRRKWQGRRPVVKCHECQAEVLGRCPTGSGSPQRSESRGRRFGQLALREGTQTAVLPITGVGEGRGWGKGLLWAARPWQGWWARGCALGRPSPGRWLLRGMRRPSWVSGMSLPT